MKEDKGVKAMEKILLKKEIDLIKKEKELNKREKINDEKDKELNKREKIIDKKAKELNKREKIIDKKAKELNQLIMDLSKLKDLPKIAIEKITKIGLINMKNEDQKKNLIQQAIITKDNINEKKERQETETEKNLHTQKKKEKFCNFVNQTTYNDEMKGNNSHHGDNQKDNGVKGGTENGK